MRIKVFIVLYHATGFEAKIFTIFQEHEFHLTNKKGEKPADSTSSGPASSSTKTDSDSDSRSVSREKSLTKSEDSQDRKSKGDSASKDRSRDRSSKVRRTSLLDYPGNYRASENSPRRRRA